LSEAILRYSRFTPFKKEQDAILALFKGTQNVVFLRDHIGHSFGRETPRYSPDFHHPFKKTHRHNHYRWLDPLSNWL
jgi:hypothetical protein